jgi:hypothetical protein|tara:strand:- start:337 stop:729 length:393 start_codon:yes stop_codon:yes gene_type:complete
MKKNFNQTIIDAVNKYDDQPTIEQEVINYSPVKVQKLSATDNYKLLKKVANQQEKKEFRDIERKYQKKKPTAQRTEPFIKVSNTRTPLNIDINPIPKFVSQQPTAKSFYNAGTKPKVSEGLARILGVDND